MKFPCRAIHEPLDLSDPLPSSPILFFLDDPSTSASTAASVSAAAGTTNATSSSVGHQENLGNQILEHPIGDELQIGKSFAGIGIGRVAKIYPSTYRILVTGLAGRHHDRLPTSNPAKSGTENLPAHLILQRSLSLPSLRRARASSPLTPPSALKRTWHTSTTQSRPPLWPSTSRPPDPQSRAPSPRSHHGSDARRRALASPPHQPTDGEAVLVVLAAAKTEATVVGVVVLTAPAETEAAVATEVEGSSGKKGVGEEGKGSERSRGSWRARRGATTAARRRKKIRKNNNN